MVLSLIKIKNHLLKLSVFLQLIILVLSCREIGTSSFVQETKFFTTDSNTIFIQDVTGKKWDVTHAVERYGFNPEQFKWGLGPFAIKPILEPKFLSPGDAGYNSIDEDELIIGTIIDGITRAYPLSVLIRYEIVDEKFDRTHVAVGY